ncbi:MAG: 2Fe-2S iron-sulfur cluster binding domain-containing protein [Vulcanimicrobiaceae bacterium]
MHVGTTHRIKFEPVDIEMEIEESETVLDAAFRQGITLMHGCKEGQCAACKSFVIDGEIDLDRYSNFALNDNEREEGFTLLCRTHVYSDATIELVNYDEEMLRSSAPIQAMRGTIAAIDALTHDICRLRIDITSHDRMKFAAGQYLDVTIPGSVETRAFSMANTPSRDTHAEFIIKRYPGGRFSGLLDGGLHAGDALDMKGPYGTCTLRASSERDLVLVGGGAGMAPLWSIVNAVAESGASRKVAFYYGARAPRDLFYLDEMRELQARMPNFHYQVALSEPSPTDDWTGEVGFISDVLERNENDLRERDAYVCGPPPMVDAAIATLERLGVPTDRIYFDKFTVTASAISA